MLVCVIIRSVSENKTSLLMISFVIVEGGRLAFTYFPAYTGVKQASELMSSCGALAQRCVSGKSVFPFHH